MKSTLHALALPLALIAMIIAVFGLGACAKPETTADKQSNEIAGTYQFIADDNADIARLSGLKGGTVTIKEDGTFHAEGNLEAITGNTKTLTADGTYKIDGENLTVTESKSQKSYTGTFKKSGSTLKLTYEGFTVSLSQMDGQ